MRAQLPVEAKARSTYTESQEQTATTVPTPDNPTSSNVGVVGIEGHVTADAMTHSDVRNLQALEIQIRQREGRDLHIEVYRCTTCNGITGIDGSYLWRSDVQYKCPYCGTDHSIAGYD